jgi:hypothetical protein
VWEVSGEAGLELETRGLLLLPCYTNDILLSPSSFITGQRFFNSGELIARLSR